MPPRPPDSTLSLQPPTGEIAQILIRAEYFEGQIDIKQFRIAHAHYPAISTNPLVLEPERQRYVCISKFGAVVFWNCNDQIVTEILQAVQNLPSAARRIQDVADEMRINAGTA